MSSYKRNQQGTQQNTTQMTLNLSLPDAGYGFPRQEQGTAPGAEAKLGEPSLTPVLTQLVYTSRDLEQLLRLSKNTINALLNSGQLRAIRCGRKWLIPRDAILEFLAQGGVR